MIDKRISNLNLPDVKSASILVVDDEPVNIKLVESVLKGNGYTGIITTTDPREVRGLCRDNEIDLILLDLNMPHLDGYEVMDQLSSELDKPVPPVLILTAQSSREFKNRAFETGAKDYVTKPFDVKEVLARVQNLVQVELFHKYLKSENRLLEEKVQERTREINQTRLEVVRRLGRAAEYRDNETGLHIVRMSKISQVLGVASGMDEYQADLLLNASPMHDIGKIGIPDNILLKPGKFEPEEWEIMKTHAEIGANILSGSDFDLLSMASEIALTHHEKWDGSGYPKGLSGKDIPLTGRICAVADVFDALTSSRPYKKAWAIDEAVKYMNEQSGSHFDPALIEQFNENLSAILQIKADFSEPDDAEAANL